MSSAVLDIGKTTLRVAIVSDDGTLEALSSAPNEVVDGPPYPHVDAAALEAWIFDALREHAARFAIHSIVPVAHGACAALLRDGSLALPVLDYEFAGPEGCDGYEAAARDFAETGSPALPAGLNLGRQLHWLAREHAAAFDAADTLLPWPQYWAQRLSGVPSYEATSLGCHTDLWSPWQDGPSSYARRSGIARRLPRRVQAWSVLGPPTHAVRAATGLSDGCRVLAGIHDSNAAFFAHRRSRSGPFAVVSTGTWFVTMAHGGRRDRLRAEEDMLVNVDALGDPLPTARFPGGREIAAISAADAPAPGASLETVLALVARGARVLPGFSALGGPFRERYGAILGVPLPDAAGRRALGSLYAALVTDLCLDRLGSDGPVVVEGRFAGDPAYVGTLAALRAEPVVASRDATGSLVGAACLAAWPEAGVPVTCGAVERPDAAAVRALEAHRDTWRRENR